jgi:hypothetical protein
MYPFNFSHIHFYELFHGICNLGRPTTKYIAI